MPVTAPRRFRLNTLSTLLFIACTGLCGNTIAAPDEAILGLAKQQKQPLLDTLKELVNIESGSGDREGLDRISQLIYDRLKVLGGEVEFIEPGVDTYRMHDTPEKVGRMVKATFKEPAAGK